MLTNTNSVIVKDGEGESCAVSLKQFSHRNFPEIWCEAATMADGLTDLARHLSRALDGAGTGWRRELLELAIADVAEQVAALKGTRPAREISRQGTPLCPSSSPTSPTGLVRFEGFEPTQRHEV